ncbi:MULTISPECIES: hypothetical protein [unclassified Acinetobacter]|uniref:hypothetical protein n=1 Tax=unclassified Acinetobacter TaxID=196816 RepID=UPI0015D11731|nr:MULTISPECIES: hypothetical protein [unclassified Acinetobacter]
MKKFTVFRSKYPLVSSLYNQGYTQAEIVEKLKLEHNLDLTVGTFKNYLHRLRKSDNLPVKAVDPVDSSGIENNVGEHNQDDNVKNEVKEFINSHLNESDSDNDSDNNELEDESHKPKSQRNLSFRDRGQMFIHELMSKP